MAKTMAKTMDLAEYLHSSEYLDPIELVGDTDTCEKCQDEATEQFLHEVSLAIDAGDVKGLIDIIKQFTNSVSPDLLNMAKDMYVKMTVEAVEEVKMIY